MKKNILLLLVTCAMCACGKVSVDNTPVESVNLDRYLGSWYEIARFDHRFERGMEQTKALYTLREDGTIKVENSGVKDGEPKLSIGKAKTTDTPALLRVSFFGPFYGDYRILQLDEEYRYVLVGGGTDDYLWILARTPQLEEASLALILDEAQRRGYDTSKLIWVKQ